MKCKSPECSGDLHFNFMPLPLMGSRIAPLMRATSSVTYSASCYRTSATIVCSFACCPPERHSAPSFVSGKREEDKKKYISPVVRLNPVLCLRLPPRADCRFPCGCAVLNRARTPKGGCARGCAPAKAALLLSREKSNGIAVKAAFAAMGKR